MAKSTKLSKKKNKKPSVSEIKKELNAKLFLLVGIHIHVKLLREDKQYFKSYSKKIGISEYSLRRIINGTYNGAIPPILAKVQRMGIRCEITYKNV